MVATRPVSAQATVPMAAAGACFPGPAATVLRRMIPVFPATPAETAEVAGEMAAVAVAAIDAENPGNIGALA